MVAAGGIDAIVEVLKEHKGNADVLAAATHSLSLLATNPKYVRRYSDTGYRERGRETREDREVERCPLRASVRGLRWRPVEPEEACFCVWLCVF